MISSSLLFLSKCVIEKKISPESCKLFMMVVKDTSLLQACWVGVDFDTIVDAGVDNEVWLRLYLKELLMVSW